MDHRSGDVSLEWVFKSPLALEPLHLRVTLTQADALAAGVPDGAVQPPKGCKLAKVTFSSTFRAVPHLRAEEPGIGMSNSEEPPRVDARYASGLVIGDGNVQVNI